MSTEKPENQPESDDDAARWPAVVGVILIILFSWAGVEVFVLQGQPIATLEHAALTSDEGASFQVEHTDQDYMVQVWSYSTGEGKGQKKKAEATVRFVVLDPAGESVLDHRDAEARADARYERFRPNEKGAHRIQILEVDGESAPKVQAVVLTGNNQILLPLIGKFVD